MTSRPSATIVICCYSLDRQVLLLRAIDTARRELSSIDHLVVVVDHNPELHDVLLGELRDVIGEQVSVLANAEARGLSGARNTGSSMALGDVVIFLDDDAVPLTGWLDDLLGEFHDPGVAAVGGRVEPAWAVGRPTWFPPEFDWVVGCSYRGQRLGDVRNPIGANMAIRRSALEAVGGFRHGLGRVGSTPLGCEETELGIRLAAGDLGRCVVIAGATVEHHVPASRVRWSYFVRRCWSEGISKAIVAGWAAEADVGTTQALATEAGHVRYLARSFGRCVATSARSHDPAPLGQGAAIAMGTTTTAVGFIRGSLARSVTS